MIRTDSSAAIWLPKYTVPRLIADTRKPVWPNNRYSILRPLRSALQQPSDLLADDDVLAVA